MRLMSERDISCRLGRVGGPGSNTQVQKRDESNPLNTLLIQVRYARLTYKQFSYRKQGDGRPHTTYKRKAETQTSTQSLDGDAPTDPAAKVARTLPDSPQKAEEDGE